MTYQQRLTEILKQYLERLISSERDFMADHITEGDYEELILIFQRKALADINTLNAETIGRDENVGIDPEWPWSKIKRRDDLRAELRQHFGIGEAV